MNAIEATDIVKEYRTYRKPRHWLEDKLTFGKLGRARVIRALDGVSASIAGGESFGIIGPNGSGKTTLLKILTGLAQPTSGGVSTRGRLAAFLELGSGFHPDFTGRQNARLNCAVMGVASRAIPEVVEKIIAFSELGEAVDDPVRTYSSGMFMRLGFSVAAALEPEILIVDEVLGVGDEYFMGKCVDRLNEFKHGGSTIVMVSHDLSLVRRFCDRVMLLQKGKTIALGDPNEAADIYLEQVYREAAARLDSDSGSGVSDVVRRGSGEIEITAARLIGADGKPARLLKTGDPFFIEIAYDVKSNIESALFGINIFRNDGVLLVSTNHTMGENAPEHPPLEPGVSGVARFSCDGLNLLEGDYSLGVSVFNDADVLPRPLDELLGAVRFKVHSARRDKGSVLLPGKWEFASE